MLHVYMKAIIISDSLLLKHSHFFKFSTIQRLYQEKFIY